MASETNPKITKAVSLIKTGEREAASKLLIEVIKAAPQSKDAEMAWYGLSTIVSTHEKKRQCLQSVLKINPNNQKAIALLAKLDSTLETQPIHSLSNDKKGIADLKKSNQQQPDQVHSTSQKKDAVQSNLSDEQLLEEYITAHSKNGWEIVNRSPSSVQLKKRKKLSRAVLLIGVLLIPAGGLGLIILLIAVIAHLAQKDKIVYITANDLRLQKTKHFKKSVNAQQHENFQGKGQRTVNGSRSLIQKIMYAIASFFIFSLLLSIAVMNFGDNNTTNPTPQPQGQISLPATFTPLASSGNIANYSALPNRVDYVNFYRAFNWTKRPALPDGRTPWAGTTPDESRKLMLWTTSNGSESINEVTFTYNISSSSLSEQQKDILSEELSEFLTLSLPNWKSKETWLQSTLNKHFSSGEQQFRTETNGTIVDLDIGPAVYYDDFTAILSIFSSD